MKNRTAAFLLLTLLFLWCSFAGASDSIPPEGFTFETGADGAVLTGWSGKDKKLTVPDTLDGLPVIAVGENAFRGNTTLTSVILPDGIARIDACAFENCTALTTVTLPDTTENIGEKAFAGCKKLARLNLPQGLDVIGAGALRTSGITELNFPSGIRRIPEGLCYGCDKLRTIRLPEGLTAIERIAFSRCKILNAAVIPESVTELEDGVFATSGVQTVTLPDGMTEIPKDFFRGCKNLKKIRLPAGITVIREGAFAASGINDLILPDGVTELCENAFDSSMISKISLPDTLTVIGRSAFANCAKLQKIDIPDSVTELGITVFNNAKALSSVTIGSGLRRIPEMTFKGTRLQKVTIPGTVSAIDRKAFAECTALKQFVLLNPETVLGEYLFFGDSALADIRLPEGLKELPENMCNNCKALNSIIFPSTLEKIGKYAFVNAGLQKVELPEGLITLENQAFGFCKMMTAVSLPDSLTYFDSSAFHGCRALKRVTCPARSFAERWALANGYQCVIVGESSTPQSFLVDFNTVRSNSRIEGRSAAVNLFDGSRNTRFCARTNKDGAAAVMFSLYHSEKVTGCTMTVGDSVELRPESWELYASEKQIKDIRSDKWVLIASGGALPEQANTATDFGADVPGEYISFKLILKTSGTTVALGGFALK